MLFILVIILINNHSSSIFGKIAKFDLWLRFCGHMEIHKTCKWPTIQSMPEVTMTADIVDDLKVIYIM